MLLLHALVASSLCVAGLPAVAGQLSAQRLENIDRVIERNLARPEDARPAKPSAISISLAVDGEPVLEKGYGVAAPGVRATAQTRYLVGSITKQFTAAALLSAVESGDSVSGTNSPLSLDTEVAEIFPDTRHWNRSSPLTIKRLLTMTANLPNFTVKPPRGLDPWGSAPAPRLLNALKRLELRSGWAGSFSYSNTSYFMLAEILDRVTPSQRGLDGTYSARLRRLFDAAGMTSTGVVGEIRSETEVAAPNYRRRPAFLKPDWLKGSGELVSNAVDLRRWNVALMKRQILNEASLSAMFGNNARVTPIMWYGMGWFIEELSDRRILSHTGFVPGFTSLNMIVELKKPKKWASIVILTNGDEAQNLDQMAGDLAFHLLFE
ncbi:MAG: serine hydrolase domain-containing protein [Filomicrobium sp.]